MLVKSGKSGNFSCLMKNYFIILLILLSNTFFAQKDSIDKILKENNNDSLKLNRAIIFIDTKVNTFNDKLILLDYLKEQTLLQAILLKIVLLHPEARVAEVVLRLGESPNSIAVHVVAGMAEAAEHNLVDFFDFWVETDLAVVVAGQTIDLFDSSRKHESLLF
jgi:hypothetical protein